MEDAKRAELTEKSSTLRSELKSWEKKFAAENQGKKASREDIKRNPDIAEKYKEYNKIRDLLSGKIVDLPPLPRNQTPKKRRHEEKGHGISKRQQISHTPSKTPSRTPNGPLRPWEVDPYESPSVVRNLFTPSRKTVLGPTPQKDGQVLGLFDLLQEEVSPSKDEQIDGKGTQASIQATPRKARAQGNQHSRTPATGKRFLMDAFATPLKNREFNEPGGKTPSSVSKLHFSTPSFLRRTHLPAVNENEEGPLSPQMVRVPRKPLVRGLSSMLAGLRKMEDEAADEDLEALHEMEAEISGNAPSQKPKPAPKPAAIVQVEDSQPTELLGGFDDEAHFDSDPEEPEVGRDGQPLKIYKKKGQKRTTRRVKMKPVRSKPSTTSRKDQEEEEEDSPDELAPIPETQIEDTGFADARNFDSDSQSEYTASEGGTRYKRAKQKNREMNKEGRVKTAARKVGALAHTNFKRLKLRNSGSKGTVHGQGSRFRRKK